MMQYDEKVLLPTSGDGMRIEPMTVLEVRCYHCGRTTRLAVPKDFTDWHKIATDFEERYMWILSRLNEYIKEVETEIGLLPSTVRFREQLFQLREMVRRKHELDRKEQEDLGGSDVS